MKSIILIAFLTFSLGASNLLAAGASELAAFHLTLLDKFDEVRHLDGDQLSSISAGDVVLIDVREKDEYEVSRLKGAIRVSPDISDRDFIEQFANIVSGKTVVFYCSVGYRSSALAEDVQEDLLKAGSKAVFNLEGGIFNWHNQRRALVNQTGASDHIHPFDQHWGRLLERPEKIRYQAAN